MRHEKVQNLWCEAEDIFCWDLTVHEKNMIYLIDRALGRLINKKGYFDGLYDQEIRRIKKIANRVTETARNRDKQKEKIWLKELHKKRGELI